MIGEMILSTEHSKTASIPSPQQTYSSSSCSLGLAATISRSIRPITSTSLPLPPLVVPSPKPSLCLTDSSSSPGRLARCFFSGLPIRESSRGFGALRSCEVAPVKMLGGVTALPLASGGVDPRVGVFDAGDFRVAGEPESSSTECCRFSCRDMLVFAQLDHDSGIITLIFLTPSANSP